MFQDVSDRKRYERISKNIQHVGIKSQKRKGEEAESMSKLLDSILSDSNINLATKQVKANKGSGGIDNITIEQIDEYMLNNWNNIKQQIQERIYKPSPV